MAAGQVCAPGTEHGALLRVLGLSEGAAGASFLTWFLAPGTTLLHYNESLMEGRERWQTGQGEGETAVKWKGVAEAKGEKSARMINANSRSPSYTIILL